MLQMTEKLGKYVLNFFYSPHYNIHGQVMVGQSTQVATAFAGSLLLVSHGLSTSYLHVDVNISTSVLL